MLYKENKAAKAKAAKDLTEALDKAKAAKDLTEALDKAKAPALEMGDFDL